MDSDILSLRIYGGERSPLSLSYHHDLRTPCPAPHFHSRTRIYKPWFSFGPIVRRHFLQHTNPSTHRVMHILSSSRESILCGGRLTYTRVSPRLYFSIACVLVYGLREGDAETEQGEDGERAEYHRAGYIPGESSRWSESSVSTITEDGAASQTVVVVVAQSSEHADFEVERA